MVALGQEHGRVQNRDIRCVHNSKRDRTLPVNLRALQTKPKRAVIDDAGASGLDGRRDAGVIRRGALEKRASRVQLEHFIQPIHASSVLLMLQRYYAHLCGHICLVSSACDPGVASSPVLENSEPKRSPRIKPEPRSTPAKWLLGTLRRTSLLSTVLLTVRGRDKCYVL